MDLLNIAPRAPKYSPASWWGLCFGLMLAGAGVAFASVQFQHFQRWQATQEKSRAQQQAFDRQSLERQRQTSTPAAQERLKVESQLVQTMDTSWSGIFDGLETSAYAVEGGVSLVSLAQGRRQPGGVQLNLVAIATTSAVMLDYVRALQGTGLVKQADITSQQPEPSIGPEAVRFRLSVHWEFPASATRKANG